MRLQKATICLLSALCFVILGASQVHAATVTPSLPEPFYAPVFVSAFQISDRLDAVELYNSSSNAVNMTDWHVSFGNENGAICQISLNEYIPPKQHVTLARADFFTGKTENIKTYSGCENFERIPTYLSLENQNENATIYFTEPGAYVRKGLTKTYRSGDFSHDFEMMSSDSRDTFFADPWYQPPKTPRGLEISEILPRAKECSPSDENPACNDYIKLYNASNKPIDLQSYQLRTGSKGDDSTAHNTYHLGGILDSGHYAVVQKADSDKTISLTNNGDWVWLEDKFGVTRYDTTIVEYPSASSTSKIGWAWAKNGADWQWTSSPTPFDHANRFSLPDSDADISSETSLKACAKNQFRNPLTNRCKLRSAKSNSLTPCRADQFRNPATNRCKSRSASSSSLTPCTSTQFRNPQTNRCKSKTSVNAHTLTPCKKNQFRNPATNRCKSRSAAASQLKPCAENQFRNPETNRCKRKVLAASAKGGDYPVEKIAATSEQQQIGWLAFAGVGVAGGSYAVWEWRREVSALGKKLVAFVSGSR